MEVRKDYAPVRGWGVPMLCFPAVLPTNIRLAKIRASKFMLLMLNISVQASREERGRWPVGKRGSPTKCRQRPFLL